MTRPLRLEFPNALYHVTSRGDRREAIFEDDDDQVRFLEIFGTVVTDHNWLCHGYCLMDNHYISSLKRLTAICQKVCASSMVCIPRRRIDGMDAVAIFFKDVNREGSGRELIRAFLIYRDP